MPFIRYYYSPATSITIRKNGKDKTFDHSAGNFVILNPGTQNENIQMDSPAFIGYGINEPEKGWDDYAGIDVKGKWVIVLNGMPSADSMNPSFPDTLRKQFADWKKRDSLKLHAFIEHKAVGIPQKDSSNKRRKILFYLSKKTDRFIQSTRSFYSLQFSLM